VRDGVSVSAFDFPVRVPAASLHNDARNMALNSRELRYASMDLLALPLDRSAPAGTVTDGRQFTASDVMAAPAKDGRWPASPVIGPNRKPIAPLDGCPIGMESTVPPVRSARI
jgi:hypothetical protein